MDCEGWREESTQADLTAKSSLAMKGRLTINVLQNFPRCDLPPYIPPSYDRDLSRGGEYDSRIDTKASRYLKSVIHHRLDQVNRLARLLDIAGVGVGQEEILYVEDERSWDFEKYHC